MISTVARKRHIAKAVTWRIVASIDTFAVAWLITGQVEWAASIASVEVLTKMFLYYLHERVWYNYSKFGVETD